MINHELQEATALELYESTVKKEKHPIEHVLPKGLSIIAGRPKEGKTIISNQMAISVASGEKFLNHFDVAQSAVLYLSLEEHRDLITERLQRIYPNKPPLNNIHFAFGWLPINEGGFEYLGNYIETKSDIKLIFIDTLSALVNGQSNSGKGYINEYGDAQKIHQIAKAGNVSVVLLHHTVKQSKGNLNDLYGSSGYSATADNIFLLNSDKARGLGKLQLSSRYGDAEYALKFNKDQGCWEYLGEADEFDLTQEREEILAVLYEAYGPMQVKFIAKELRKKVPATSNLLKKLLKQGLVFSPSYGAYELTGDGKNAFASQL
jgi:hypothetical protein